MKSISSDKIASIEAKRHELAAAMAAPLPWRVTVMPASYSAVEDAPSPSRGCGQNDCLVGASGRDRRQDGVANSDTQPTGLELQSLARCGHMVHLQ